MYLNISLRDVMRYPNNIIPPPQGAVNFNVDGASKGKPGPARIGGILRDHMGIEKIRFSKYICVADSNVAELLAVREAFSLFVSYWWNQNLTLIIESDSMNVVNWVLKPYSALLIT
ncbi:hypothetical protein DITRI_Ditri20bG0081400 [Diplodiscus trichospermus]